MTFSESPISRFDVNKAKTVAQKTSSKSFNNFIFECKTASFYGKLETIAIDSINTAMQTIFLRISEYLATTLTNITPPVLFNIVYFAPLINFASNTYSTITKESNIDHFIEEMYKYRCCDENNLDNQECMGKTPDTEACLDYS